MLIIEINTLDECLFFLTKSKQNEKNNRTPTYMTRANAARKLEASSKQAASNEWSSKQRREQRMKQAPHGIGIRLARRSFQNPSRLHFSSSYAHLASIISVNFPSYWMLRYLHRLPCYHWRKLRAMKPPPNLKDWKLANKLKLKTKLRLSQMLSQ